MALQKNGFDSTNRLCFAKEEDVEDAAGVVSAEGTAAVAGVASAVAGVSDVEGAVAAEAGAVVGTRAGRAWLPRGEGARIGSGGAPLLGSMPLLGPESLGDQC